MRLQDKLPEFGITADTVLRILHATTILVTSDHLQWAPEYYAEVQLNGYILDVQQWDYNAELFKTLTIVQSKVYPLI